MEFDEGRSSPATHKHAKDMAATPDGRWPGDIHHAPNDCHANRLRVTIGFNTATLQE
jgi:hypothetical protein